MGEQVGLRARPRRRAAAREVVVADQAPPVPLGRRYQVGLWLGGGTPSHCGQPMVGIGTAQWGGATLWACHRCCVTYTEK